jgi:hypothetical protein
MRAVSEICDHVLGSDSPVLPLPTVHARTAERAEQ